MINTKGKYIVERRTIDLLLSKPAYYITIYMLILNRVAFKDNSKCKRGQIIFENGVKDIVNELGVSRQEVYRFLRWAKSVNIISNNTEQKAMLIEVLNYITMQRFRNNNNEVSVNSSNQKWIKKLGFKKVSALPN